MNLRSIQPPAAYDVHDQAMFRQAAAAADQANLKRGGDIQGRVILQSPDGTRYALTVANGGGLSAVVL